MRNFYVSVVKTISAQLSLSPATNQSFCEQQNDLIKDGDKSPITESSKQEPLYYNLFPQRQLYRPKIPYPLWDYNWDGKLNSQHSTQALRKHGVTRHIILIRHGQYDETHHNDDARVLTPLGESQAHQTGKRLARMIQDIESMNAMDDPVQSQQQQQQQQQQPGKVVAIRVSNLARAKQTADIISSYLPPSVLRLEPDADLNEGRPCHSIPFTDKPIDLIETQQGLPLVSSSIIRHTDEGHERIERAFHRYFYRSLDWVDSQVTDDIMTDPSRHIPPTVRHEYEIIVCHANVIRYFVCRALQIPPEAWLRFCVFNCSLTYLTIRPTGTVSCRMIGDIGHLDYDLNTFSMHHGFNW